MSEQARSRQRAETVSKKRKRRSPPRRSASCLHPDRLAHRVPQARRPWCSSTRPVSRSDPSSTSPPRPATTRWRSASCFDTPASQARCYSRSPAMAASETTSRMERPTALGRPTSSSTDGCPYLHGVQDAVYVPVAPVTGLHVQSIEYSDPQNPITSCPVVTARGSCCATIDSTRSAFTTTTTSLEALGLTPPFRAVTR
jgi:hypothetical protein